MFASLVGIENTFIMVLIGISILLYMVSLKNKNS